MHLSDRYRELYLNQMGQNPVSARSIATRAKLHQSTLSHFALKGGQMRYDHLVALLDAAGIDRLRSVLAVEVLQDPDSYDNPAIKIVADILPSLLQFLTSHNMKLVDPFRTHETGMISEHIAKYLFQVIEKRQARQNALFEQRYSLGRA